MELVQIKNHTWVIPGATYIGVYIFDDGECLLIDSGFNQLEAKNALKLLQEKHLKVWGIINTHAHGDHVGGNQYIQNQTQCNILARTREALLVNHPELQPGFLFGANPLPILQVPFIMAPASRVTQMLEPGNLEIKGKLFEILDLSGHSVEHAGVVTPDGVVFLGDSLMEESMLEESPCVYSAYIEESVRSIQRLRERKEKLFYMAHSGKVENLYACIDKNLQVFQDILDWYVQLIQEQGRTREELLQFTINERVKKVTTLRYFLVQTTVSAYLSYLCKKKVIHTQVRNGRLLFVLKKDYQAALEGCRFL